MAMSLKDFVVDAKTRIGEISAADTAKATAADPKILVLDVREPGEFADGHLPGALNVPRGMLEAKADLDYGGREPRLADRSQRVIINCASGGRSALAADALQKMGFTSVQSLAGGIQAWKDQGLPIEK